MSLGFRGFWRIGQHLMSCAEPLYTYFLYCMCMSVLFTLSHIYRNKTLKDKIVSLKIQAFSLQGGHHTLRSTTHTNVKLRNGTKNASKNQLGAIQNSL